MIQSLKRSVLGIPLALAMVAFVSDAFAQDPRPAPLGLTVPPSPAAARAAPANAPVATAAPAAEAAPTQLDSVLFEPEGSELTLMIQSGEMPYRNIQRFRHTWYYERGVVALYTPICDGPCATQLVEGAYHLALSKKGGKPVPAGVVVVDGPSALRASYEDHGGARMVGGIIFLGGVVGGGVMIVAAFTHGPTDDPLLAGGVGVFVGSAILGTILASQRDAAHIRVTPLSLPVVGQRDLHAATFGRAPAPQGAAVMVTF